MRTNIRIGLLAVCSVALTIGFCRAAEQRHPAAFSAATFQEHVAYLASDELAGRAPGSEGSAKAADYVVRHFVRYGLKILPGQDSWFQEFSLTIHNEPKEEVTARNILGVRPGWGKLKDEAVVVCAHYDHLGVDSTKPDGEDAIYNGAADNASGVAALLMMADALQREQRAPAEWQRTVLFVIPKSPAEKHGLKPGDRITAINGTEFERAEDALFIFQQLSFEDGLRMSILRGDESLDVHLPASVFDAMTGPKGTRQPNGMYRVIFEYKADKGVKEVYLAGEFNDWKPKALRMNGPDENGLFTTQFELAEGVYQYKFVIEGERWEPDPKNMYRVGKYNNSVLSVGNGTDRP